MKAVLLTMGLVLLLGGCEPPSPAPQTPRRVAVVASLFPVYDMARAVAGAHGEVSLLLPPGSEAHGFEPQPGDIMTIQRADLFIYIHRAMEPWAERLASNLDQSRVAVVAAGEGVVTRPAQKDMHHEHHEHHGREDEVSIDPHLWLDFDNARRMTDQIAVAFMRRDPQHAADYRANAEQYKSELADLDRAYAETLSNCQNRILLHGGHFAFGYLAERYRLDYRAAAAFSPDAEPTPARVAELVDTMRRLKLRTIFSEELATPRLAETIARECGATILPLSAGHNVTKSELAAHMTFPELMRRNLDRLKAGLSCR